MPRPAKAYNRIFTVQPNIRIGMRASVKRGSPRGPVGAGRGTDARTYGAALHATRGMHADPPARPATVLQHFQPSLSYTPGSNLKPLKTTKESLKIHLNDFEYV